MNWTGTEFVAGITNIANSAAELDDAPYYQNTLRVLYLMVAAGMFPSTL